jgi:ABC-2 type transport system permease protein
MKGFIAFTKKEFIEQIRTYRLLIMISVFFLIGMMSPLLAKLLPQIMSDVKVQGITLTIPEPTFIDAYSQFFKNMTNMGMIIFLLIFGGIISNELTRGTLVNILAKGLPRVTVILAKYTAALTLWTVSFCLSALTNYGYTIYFFEDFSKNLIFSLFCLWLFGAFVLALIFLSSTLVDGNFGGLILTAVVLVCMLVINSFPNTEKFNPVYLASENMALIAGTQSPDDFVKPLLITAALIAGCLYASVLLFRKKRL